MYCLRCPLCLPVKTLNINISAWQSLWLVPAVCKHLKAWYQRNSRCEHNVYLMSKSVSHSHTHLHACSCPFPGLTMLTQCVSLPSCLFSTAADYIFFICKWSDSWLLAFLQVISLPEEDQPRGRFDVARWPSMQKQETLIRAETGACSVICQIHYCGVGHVVAPAAYRSHGSNRVKPSWPSQGPAS